MGYGVDMPSTDFAKILERAPNLQSLTLSTSILEIVTQKFTNQIVCQQLSQRIQSLTITERYFYTPRLGIVTVRLLNSIARVFSTKCQHLSLALVAHPKTVCPILRRMRQLRSLHIQWRFGSTDLDDPVPLWLQYQPTASTSSDFVYSNDEKHLFVWFGNRF
jgi:hypothetical protein